MDAIKRRLQAAGRFKRRRPVLAFPVAAWSTSNDDQAGNLAALTSSHAFAALFRAQAAELAGPATKSRGKHGRLDDWSSLEGQAGRDGQADPAGQTLIPPSRGEPSASDMKAGSAR